jgi:hypothetical protein
MGSKRSLELRSIIGSTRESGVIDLNTVARLEREPNEGLTTVITRKLDINL